MQRWLQDKGKNHEAGHYLEHPEMCQATKSGILCIPMLSLCLELQLVTCDYHHVGCSGWFEEQERCCQQRCTTDLWVNSKILLLQDSSVLSTTPLESCLVSAHFLPQQAEGTAACLGVSLGQLKALQ